MGVFSRDGDSWRVPAFLLWVVFFLVGLLPEPVFLALRSAGGVYTGNALINSPYAISLTFSAYIGLFGFFRCWRGGLSAYESQDRAMQLIIIALVAFLPIDPMTLLTAYKSPALTNVVAVYLAAGLKVGGWWYLLSLLFRYYLMNNDSVFSRIPSVFPSARHFDEKKDLLSPKPIVPLDEDKQGTHEGTNGS